MAVDSWPEAALAAVTASWAGRGSVATNPALASPHGIHLTSRLHPTFATLLPITMPRPAAAASASAAARRSAGVLSLAMLLAVGSPTPAAAGHGLSDCQRACYKLPYDPACVCTALTSDGKEQCWAVENACLLDCIREVRPGCGFMARL